MGQLLGTVRDWTLTVASNRTNHSPLEGSNPLYPSKRLLAGRHCRLAEPGRPTGSSLRILCFEHLEGTCAPAGRPRRKSRGRLRFERPMLPSSARSLRPREAGSPSAHSLTPERCEAKTPGENTCPLVAFSITISTVLVPVPSAGSSCCA